jgi:hypothetical protein
MPRKGKEPKTRAKLSERAIRAAEAYCGPAKGNMTQACRIAGYGGSAAVLRVQGTRLLANPNFKAKVEELSSKVRSAAIASVKETQERLTAVLRNDPTMHRRVVTASGRLAWDPRKITPELSAYYAEHKRFPHDADVYFLEEVSAGEITRACMDLLKARGALTDNVNVKVEGGLKSLLPELQKTMRPESFADFVQAFTRIMDAGGAK